jgi:hypothetical protein
MPEDTSSISIVDFQLEECLIKVHCDIGGKLEKLEGRGIYQLIWYLDGF